MALKTSEVVAALAIDDKYMLIKEYIKPKIERDVFVVWCLEQQLSKDGKPEEMVRLGNAAFKVCSQATFEELEKAIHLPIDRLGKQVDLPVRPSVIFIQSKAKEKPLHSNTIGGISFGECQRLLA